MQMHKLVTGLLSNVSPRTRKVEARRHALEQTIERLRRRQDDLQRRLAAEPRVTRQRRLKIDLEAAQLQYKTALALRVEL